MATIAIHSQLDHFRLIDAICQADSAGMTGTARFEHALPFAGMEAMAQLAAMHVRYCVDFGRHAFLLKVLRCAGLPGREMDGNFTLAARQAGRSNDAFRYGVTAEGEGGADVCFSSELLVGVQDYDDRFRARRLKGHYQRMFDRMCGRSAQCVD